MTAVNGAVEYVGPIGKRKSIRDWFEKEGQLFNREKKPAQEDHGKAEKVGEGLRLEYLAYTHGDEKAQKSRGYGDQKDSRHEPTPGHRGQIGQEYGYDYGNEGVDRAEQDGSAGLG